MYEIRVKADFCAAHFLQDYNGKCENLHGHNYKVYAHVCGKELDKGGMLLDFTKLKSALRSVCGKLDHSNLNDVAFFNNNPSAERIAEYIYAAIIEILQSEGINLKRSENANGTYLSAVDVFETESCRARYTESENPKIP